MRRIIAKLLAVATLAGSAAGLTGGTALADPPPPLVPNPQDIVGVGSHTTGPLFNQFSTDYNAALASAGDTTSPRLYSFDATGPSPITLKQGAPQIGRPIDVGTGLGAQHVWPSAIDFVRSDRGPQAGDLPSDLFVAFAKDAVSWAAQAGGHAPANLTTAQLKDIYTCVSTKWSDIDATWPNATIKPFLPPPSSGTRAFFLKALGGGVPLSPGACVVSGPEENQGTDQALNDQDAVFPYSVGHFIGQAYLGRGTATDSAGPLTVRNINGIIPVTAARTINPSFAATTYGRVLYDVVRDSDWNATDTHGQALRKIFGVTGWICSPAGQADTRSYGFLVLPAGACGSTIHI
ncbi:substrate-binding domain-containing protein [Kitasatospora sp. NPDC058032]|uniref:substrate-binding domain-containing protein n=1 Tax=Kitasatospora sp. NPDC058032 TaxID=3346307 RepID=UPI0036DB0B24